MTLKPKSIWTEELVAKLKELYQAGLSAQTIADRMGHGLTRNAVIGKCHRLKLFRRLHPASPYVKQYIWKNDVLKDVTKRYCAGATIHEIVTVYPDLTRSMIAKKMKDLGIRPPMQHVEPEVTIHKIVPTQPEQNHTTMARVAPRGKAHVHNTPTENSEPCTSHGVTIENLEPGMCKWFTDWPNRVYCGAKVSFRPNGKAHSYCEDHC
jgi:hypothetical protein